MKLVLIIKDVIAGMKYGTFGREDGALVILYNRLGLDVKILQRQFNFSVGWLISNTYSLGLQSSSQPIPGARPTIQYA